MSVQNIYEWTPGAICGGGAGGTHTPLATCHLPLKPVLIAVFINGLRFEC